jgi:hypothetical protein
VTRVKVTPDGSQRRMELARSALRPAFPDPDRAACEAALARRAGLRQLILSQGLGPLWHARLKVEEFQPRHEQAALAYLAQRAALRQVDELFDGAGIAHVVIKGAVTRELVYDFPASRPSADIDLLVAPADRVAAARLLIDAGYRLRLDARNMSHQVTLSRAPVHIDLHWHIVRPGRIRVSLTEALIANRRRIAGMWAVAESDALFLLLVHPALTEYVSATDRGLLRLADLALWLHRRPIDWQPACDRLRALGVAAAAWAMLRRTRSLAPAAFHASLDPPMDQLRPGRIRAAYLGGWLDHDLPRRFARLHAGRLIGFSLLLHDRPADALRAVDGVRRARFSRREDFGAFEGLPSSRV